MQRASLQKTDANGLCLLKISSDDS